MTPALLFDLDGTLADTASELHAAAAAALSDLQLPPVPFEEAREYIGDGMPRFLKRLITRQWWGEPTENLYQQAYERMTHHYQNYCNRSNLYAHVPETLAQFKTRALPMACVTNKAERYSKSLLEKSGIAHYFSVVVGGDTLSVKKPDPAPLQEAMRHLAVTAENTIMVGDSIADSRAAVAAGCQFICMRYGYHRAGMLPPADYYADCFSQITRWV
ncbi:MAG: HAD-IIIA family hydrolase [Proteobacteria bacterium]|nr:HAD-IIIA family hydrolase [Pseudomonadota bacterium]